MERRGGWHSRLGLFAAIGLAAAVWAFPVHAQGNDKKAAPSSQERPNAGLRGGRWQADPGAPAAPGTVVVGSQPGSAGRQDRQPSAGTQPEKAQKRSSDDRSGRGRWYAAPERQSPPADEPAAPSYRGRVRQTQPATSYWGGRAAEKPTKQAARRVAVALAEPAGRSMKPRAWWRSDQPADSSASPALAAQPTPTGRPNYYTGKPKPEKSDRRVTAPTTGARPARPTRSTPVVGSPTPRTEVETAVRPWAGRMQQQIRSRNLSARTDKPTKQVKREFRRPDGTVVTPEVVQRGTNPIIKSNFTVISTHHGRPGFDFVFLPRPVSSFDLGYQLGFRDGFFSGVHFGSSFHHRRPVTLFFYYPFYFDDPFYNDFWYDGYYPSIYHYYGWVPRWCYPPSLAYYSVDPYPFSYGYFSGPRYYYQNDDYARRPSLDERGVDRTLQDLRRAWLENDIDRLAYHIRQNEKISIYFDNDYSYSLSADDYYSMTLDAMSTLKTSAMDFNDPTWINPREVFFTGRHVFVNPDNERQTVYISYRLHKYDDRWYIIGVGSSPNSIENSYRDFRYEDNYDYDY